MRRPAAALAAALAALLAAGCVSADEVYNRGQELETRGRLEEAFDHYARALARAPEMRKAQGRLRVVGRTLVAGHLARAAAAPSAPAAADAYLVADAYVHRAYDLGLDLDAPPTFVEDRDAALDAAARTLADDAEAALDARRWPDALAAADRAGRYGPAPDVAGRLAGAARGAHAGWAREELDAGRFRAAYEQAAAALAVAGPHDPDLLREMEALQVAIEERGAVRAVVAPVQGAGERPPRGAPEALLDEVERLLADGPWRRPPPFVRVMDPAVVRREARYYTRGFDHPPDLAAFARRLQADVGVVVRVERLRREAAERDRDSVTVRRRSGGDVRILRLEEEVTLHADVLLRAARAGDAAEVCRDEAAPRASRRITRAVYAGRTSDLDLSREQRDWFDEGALAREERRLEDDLAGALAEEIARRAYECLGRQVR